MKKVLILSALSVVLGAANLAAQCAASFTWSQSQPNVIDFVDASTMPAPQFTEYDWDFGDSQQHGWSMGPAPQSHTYGVPGTYVVCLTASDSFNMVFCSYCDTITVTGSLICQVSLWANAFNAACPTCPNGYAYCMLDTGGTAPYSYLWSTGDTTTTVSTLLPGSYTVCVTDANGCTSCDTVTVGSAPPGNCQIIFYYYMQNSGQVAYTAYVSNVSQQYSVTWDYGDQTYGTSSFGYHQYAASGTYNVCATVYDSVNQCSDTYCYNVPVTITNPGACEASFYIEMDTAIANQAWVYNQVVPTATMQYQWSWGDNTPDDYTANPSHVYSQMGSYMLCLVTTDPAVSCTDTLCQYIQVFRLTPEAAATPLYVNVLAPLGIEDHGTQLNWSLSPNPVNAVLTVNGNLNAGDHYFVADLAGRTVANGTFVSYTVDVQELSAGMYVFTIVKENGVTESKRFIRE